MLFIGMGEVCRAVITGHEEDPGRGCRMQGRIQGRLTDSTDRCWR